MNLIHLGNGLIFLMIATGIMFSICLAWTVESINDKEDYAGIMAIITITLSIIFLASGFFGFAIR